MPPAPMAWADKADKAAGAAVAARVTLAARARQWDKYMEYGGDLLGIG